MKKAILALVLALGVFTVGSGVVGATSHSNASFITPNTVTPPAGFLNLKKDFKINFQVAEFSGNLFFVKIYYS